MTGSKKGELFWKIFPWTALAAAYLLSVLFLLWKGESFLDSDMASEMVLAHQLNQEGRFISPNWYYSTELRVVSEQPLFKLGLWLFPQNWHLARVSAQAILMAGLAASYLFFSFGIRIYRGGVYAATALLCPFGTWYAFHGMLGGFYYVHMLLFLWSLGLFVRVLQSKGRRRMLWMAGLLIVSAAAGLNGVRTLMNLYAPLLLTSLLLWGRTFVEESKPLRQKNRERELVLVSLAAAIASACGYLVNTKILTRFYHFMVQGRYWAPLNLNKLWETWGDFLSLFGYQSDRYLDNQVELFSAVGILNCFALLLIAALLFSVFRLFGRWRCLSFWSRFAVMLLVLCLLVDGMVFGFTEGDGGGNATYWLPIVPLCFTVLSIEGTTERLHGVEIRRGAALGFLLTIAACSAATMMRLAENPMRAPQGIKQVCEWLEYQNYTKGYSSFWTGNILTELSNGKIEVWVTETGTMQFNQWLQSTAHHTPPQGGPVFVLVSAEEYQKMPYLTKEHLEYGDEQWYVFVYDSAQEILQKSG